MDFLDCHRKIAKAAVIADRPAGLETADAAVVAVAAAVDGIIVVVCR